MSINGRAGVTTSDQANKPYQCHNCRKRTALVVERSDRRMVCADCLPERERSVITPAQEPDAGTE